MSKRAETKATALVRCAIYTRKSSEEGLEQEFNSLDAQRESGEAYIASQKNEGWVCLPDRYDDGGFTGGNMDRPALKRLMADMEAGKVDCIVVYKVDRLSRSLIDFARLMEVFERKRISFVSVTQQFNTTQSMGRLTLNILLSFAQFEREIISERTRDKIAAARRKGKWIGGRPLLGYNVDQATKKLIVNEDEAAHVREIFGLYLEKRSLIEVSRELNGRGWRTKHVTPAKGKPYGGREWDKPAVFKLLTNIAYTGMVRYKTEVHSGEHSAIVDDELWKEVQSLLRHNGRSGGMLARNKHGALLKGLIRCVPCDLTMGHTYATKNGKRIYRYYVCYKAQKQGWDSCPCRSLPAEQIEAFVVDQIKRIGQDPALRSMTLAKLREQADLKSQESESSLTVIERELTQVRADLNRAAADAATNPHATARLADLHEKAQALEREAASLRCELSEADAGAITKDGVDLALSDFDHLWATLSPKEQARLIRMLIQRVDYDARKGKVAITFHPLGLRSLGGAPVEEEAA